MSRAYGFISSTMADASAWASNLKLPGGRKGSKQADGPSAEYIILAAAVCVIFPFDLYQLVFMSVGAFCYWAVQSGPQFSRNKMKKPSSPVLAPSSSPEQPKAPWRRPARSAPAAFQEGGGQERSSHKQLAKTAPGDGYGKEEKVVKTVTMRPIETPVFQSSGFDSEVAELVSKLKASPESIRAVEQLAGRVRRAIRQVLPEADVVGFSSSDFRQTKAFGVAVPEVDIVITVNPDDLARRCQGGRLSAAKTDVAKMHKSAIRLCAERLVSNGGFKFRRSAFRGPMPKVTLLAVHEAQEPIPLDLSVNSLTPMHNMALLAECERIDPRAKELILLVRRWAKDRGVCHAAKGDLSPYLWSLLAIYFLQLDECSEGPILPSLDVFELPEGLRSRRNGAKWTPPARTGEPMTVAALFKEFVHFYGGVFDWRNEAISIRQGARAPAHVKLPLHHILKEGSTSSVVGPTIEDPFEAARNLGTCMNATSFTRLQEELARAKKLCCNGASLTGLLELWSPPDNEVSAECAESSNM